MNLELIPAIDIIAGQCVRLTRGDYAAKTVYDADPVAVACRLEQQGFHRLHVVDLDGAKARHVVNVDVLRAITSATRLVVDFGGGIKSDDDLRETFSAGAAMVTVGSVAATEPDLMERWLAAYGPDRFILGADVRQGRLAINGWLDHSDTDLIDFIRHYHRLGLRRVLCTDIDRDGMLSGPAIDLYRSLLDAFPDLALIASGGVSSNADLETLDAAGVPAVVFGKAYYEGRLDLSRLLASDHSK